jgi:hypothetical protein
MAIKKFNQFIFEEVNFTTSINTEALTKIKNHTKTTLLSNLSANHNENRYNFYKIEDLIARANTANIDAKKLITELSNLIIKHSDLLWPNIKNGKSAEEFLVLVINDIKQIITREIQNVSWPKKTAIKTAMLIKFGSKEKYIAQANVSNPNLPTQTFGFANFSQILKDLVDGSDLTQPENRFISQDTKDLSRINYNKYRDNNFNLFNIKVPQWYREILGTVWDTL